LRLSVVAFHTEEVVAYEDANGGRTIFEGGNDNDANVGQ
jgi:hypothetical protein